MPNVRSDVPTTDPTGAPAPGGALLIGNLPWLDFVNTEFVERGTRRDALPSFRALVEWLVAAGLLAPEAARDARARWEATPEGGRVHGAALALRRTLRELAEQLADGQLPGADVVAAINLVLRARTSYPQLVAVGGRFEERRAPVGDDPLGLLAPVAASASAVLARGDRTLVKRCDNPACILYFYDTTKNHGRRFCSPATCGNRVKAAARYRRLRAAGRTVRRD